MTALLEEQAVQHDSTDIIKVQQRAVASNVHLLSVGGQGVGDKADCINFINIDSKYVVPKIILYISCFTSFY